MSLSVGFETDSFMARSLVTKRGSYDVVVYPSGDPSVAYFTMMCQESVCTTKHDIDSFVPREVKDLPGYRMCGSRKISGKFFNVYVVFTTCEKLFEAFQT